MSFMQPQIWQENVYIVETTIGTETIPASVAGDNATLESLADYLEGKPYIDDEFPNEPLTAVSRWCYRMSAPGYMDCTDTGNADSELEACEELLEMYGNQDRPEFDEGWEAEMRERIAELSKTS